MCVFCDKCHIFSLVYHTKEVLKIATQEDQAKKNEAVYHLRFSTHLITGGRWQILSSYPTIHNSDSLLLPLPLLTPPPRCDAAARPGVHARPYLGGTRYTAGHPPRRTVRNPEQIPVADRRTQLDAARPLQRTTNRRNRRWCTTICPSGGPVRMWHTSGAVQRREQYHQALSPQLSPQMSHRERTTCPCAGQKCEQYHREPKSLQQAQEMHDVRGTICHRASRTSLSSHKQTSYVAGTARRAQR